LNIEASELDRTIDEVRHELKSMLMKKRKLIEKLGFAFEKVVANAESVCEEIKNCLKEEIEKGLISTRTIEQSCLSEWKKKTRPKHENEIFSFSQSKPDKEEQKQRKIILDNHGNPVQDAAENHYSDSSQKADFRQDEKEITYQNDELLDRLHRTVKELIFENKKIRQEKDEIHARLGEALESLHVQKQRESELLGKQDGVANRLEQHQNVFDTEFSIDYRQLQKCMAQIYKSTERQEVWFTAKIDANKKKVVSAQIGRKLLSQNITESGK
jgi:uncharacterized protein Yka (UPF0111/DUF47 family)